MTRRRRRRDRLTVDAPAVHGARPADAPAIVFIHGTRLTRAAWAPQLDASRDAYRCVAVDLPGTARGPASAFTLDGAADAGRGDDPRGQARRPGGRRRPVARRLRGDDARGTAPGRVRGLVLAGCYGRAGRAFGRSPFRALAVILERLRRAGFERVNALVLPDPLPGGHRRADRRRRVLVGRRRPGAARPVRRALPAPPGRLPGPDADPQRRWDLALPAVRPATFAAAARDARRVRLSRRAAPLQPRPAGRVQRRPFRDRCRQDARRREPADRGRTDPRGILRRPPNPLSPEVRCASARPSSLPPAGAPGSCPPPRRSPRRCCRSSTSRSSSTRSRRRSRPGIEQVIIVTSSQKRAIEDHFDLYYELEHLLEEKGEIEMLRQVRAHQRPRPGRLRPPEGAAGPRPRGAHGQGPHRPRAVRGDPARRRGHRRPARASAS